ncbi:PrsW family intramembrane metalloprotease [Amnibacterium flavum]|uniref:PrsW family intramembrane metalloprotease n=1 Tax=Amnibacterium flavum TaxID=2173173 RepID=A0A2V1HQE9_9MICO|nr:PrsW family glutamic-type intramembrane protease [Amnibacterium flavum]PVZ93349.1 hypothetical protein DDQ50_15320 [Amnibacterium flavum]
MSTVLDKDATPAVHETTNEHHTRTHTSRAEKKAEKKGGPVRHTHTALVLAAGFAVWLYLGLVPIHLMHNTAVVPAWALLGAALVPGVILWIMSHRLAPSDTITAEKIVQTAAIGGFLAITIASTLDALTGMIPQPVEYGHGAIQLALAGFVEEFAKAVLIVALGWGVAKTARNGLFIGGAVGAGFAIVETTYYILAAYDGRSPVAASAFVMFERGLTAPFMHILWSAVLGAAIFAAARGSRFRLTFGVIGAYILVALLHGIYDGGGDMAGILLKDPAISGLFDFPLMLGVIIGGAFIWRHVARKNKATEASVSA